MLGVGTEEDIPLMSLVHLRLRVLQLSASKVRADCPHAFRPV